MSENIKLPPLGPHDHPEPRSFKWDSTEIRAIQSYALESVRLNAAPVPDCRVVDKGFRFDGEKQQHIPQLVIEFEPVPVNGPFDAKGWKDRDALAAMLAAAPEPQGVPARMSCRKCGKPHPNPDCKYITPSDIEQENQMEPHPDDAAVDAFATAMKEKLAKAREKGRSGWQTCPPETLSRMLHEHVEKGDPLDVANFCMFLWSLGYAIEPNSELMKTAMQWAERAGYAERALAAHPQQSGAAQPEQERNPLWHKFDQWYWKATASPSADNWMQAALVARRIYTGITRKESP